MVIARHRCEKCLEYMSVEKNGSNYVLKCPGCEKKKDGSED